jgi:A/G-specific adenine glycosylase
MQLLMNKKEVSFVKKVQSFYRTHGRHTLPWRKTKNPYHILVSEVMLQQTQVDRVVPKYKAFLSRFKTVHNLADASLKDVLILWQGLGYNRRAKMLHACAQEVVRAYGGKFPRTHATLVKLPGIGPYTASAVMAFAYGIATPLIETNVRTVYLHHFFKDVDDVHDVEILKIVNKTLPQEAVREWYWALMDYGSYLKKEVGNLNTQSKHYTKQSAFKGSDRQIRGAIIRTLTTGNAKRLRLHTLLSEFEDIRIDAQLQRLEEEGIISFVKGTYTLPH